MFNLKIKLQERVKKIDAQQEDASNKEEQEYVQEEINRVIPRTTHKWGNIAYEEIENDYEIQERLNPFSTVAMLVIIGVLVTSNKSNIDNLINTISNKKTNESGKTVKKPNNQKVNFDKMSDEEFFEYIAPFAIESRDKYGIYPSVTMAQAACESGFGRDPRGENPLPSKYNNFFGVKATSETNEYWDGEKVKLYTSNDGQAYNYFKVYRTMEDSFNDHGKIFEYDRYKEAIKCFKKNKGPKEQARAIANGGYAESQNYAETLYNEYIKKYNLEKYDTMNLEAFMNLKKNIVTTVEDIEKTAFDGTIVYDEKSKRYMLEEREL